MIYELASFFQEMPQFVNVAIVNVLSKCETIDLLQTASNENQDIEELIQELPSLRNSYIKAINSICQHCPSKISPTEFNLMQQQLLKMAESDSFSKENLTSMMESICDVGQAQLQGEGL